jgi:hypothetical protein
MRRVVLAGLLFVPFVAAREGKTEVAILGAIHGSHLKSKAYSVATVIATIRNYRPDVVLVEVPPDLFAPSVARIDRTGFATTRADLAGLKWIGSFPEIYRGVIPLRKEMGYEVVPVSGWTPQASADRTAFWKGPAKRPPYPDRRRLYDAVAAAVKQIHTRERSTENPAFVNSRHYADLYQLERTLWSACFDDGLGAGGEVAINRAHWARISAALDAHRGRRVLIVYGAAHRYWFLRELAKRDDVTLLDVAAYLPRG